MNGSNLEQHRRLYADVKKVLDKNKLERHIRGGEATKRKYKQFTRK